MAGIFEEGIEAATLLAKVAQAEVGRAFIYIGPDADGGDLAYSVSI